MAPASCAPVSRLSSSNKRLHERQVDRDGAVDPRAEHLDRDVAAVVEAGAVHDGDGRPADGDRVEPRERLIDAHAELVLDERGHLRVGDRGPGVEAGPELL